MNNIVFTVFIGYWFVMATHSSRILLLPFAWKSHVFEITNIGQSLADKGHDIYIILPPSYPDFNKSQLSSSITVIGYELKDPDFHTLFPPESGATLDLLEGIINKSPVDELRKNVEGFTEMCTNILSDDVMFTKLQELNFDLVIADVFPCSRCQLIIPYRLGIPQVALTTTYEPWLIRNPALPSFVPFILGFGYENTANMNFMERLINTYQLLDWSYSTRIIYNSDEFLKPFYKDKPFRSVNRLASDSKLWLFDTDVLIDYSRPTMPNEINIGGLSTKPAKPLPEHLKEMLDAAQNGIIVASFGSFDALTGTRLQMFLDAFGKLDQLVIFRSIRITSEMYVPANVKIMEWIPQNDLLGHPNTRLFITHCGANGQFEALYHAVPMLGFPIFGDQPYNARRSAYHGFGLHLSLKDFTTEELTQSINTIISNRTFYENIRRASDIYKARFKTPVDRAVYWVEEVLHGRVDHLQSHALNMEWYEFLMLDIAALMVMLMIVMLVTMYMIVWWCVVTCKSKNGQKSKRE